MKSKKILSPILAAKVAGWSAAKQLRLASVLEDWAAQLRRNAGATAKAEQAVLDLGILWSRRGGR